MADMYDNTTCSSSSYPPEPDDISLFLHQILRRGRSSPSLMPHKGKEMTPFPPSHFPPEFQPIPVQSSVVPGPVRISTVPSSSGLNSSSGIFFSSSGGCFPGSGTNLSSSSVGTIEHDPDDYDCESEDGFEALVEGASAKLSPPRNPSKRSRAAEVHNLSEKRRRSRINEKMKALQNLIPNSNKTDKASMLDDAIEYLKQLQLEVQMLTMRNGLSLHPMCLPGVTQPSKLSQMRMGFYAGNGSLNINMTGTLPLNQETCTNSGFHLPNQCTNPNQPSVANMSNIINSENSFGLEPMMQAQRRPFQLHTNTKEICREGMLPSQQLNMDHSGTNSVEFHMGVKATSSICSDVKASDLKDDSLEACIVGINRSECLQLTNLECDPILSPQFDGLHTRSASSNDIKSERPDL